tara:strand:- start:402 stop:899 length:498 start_codon:yes stop_codon:yes gene_type:complete
MTDTTEHTEIAELKAEIAELKAENELYQDATESEGRLLEQMRKGFQEEIKELKDEQAKAILGAKVDTWRECQMQFNSQFDTWDTLAFIRQECISGDNQLIKEIFDIHEEPFYWDIEKDDIINGDEESEEEDYDTDNEEHSHECDNCSKNAPDDQHLCGHCRSESD